MALTGSQTEPEPALRFPNGTTEEADGPVSEPRFVFSGRQFRQSLVAACLPLVVCIGLVVSRHSCARRWYQFSRSLSCTSIDASKERPVYGFVRLEPCKSHQKCWA